MIRVHETSSRDDDKFPIKHIATGTWFTIDDEDATPTIYLKLGPSDDSSGSKALMFADLNKSGRLVQFSRSDTCRIPRIDRIEIHYIKKGGDS